MRKRILPGILSIALVICAVAAVVSVTYAWLTPGEPVAFEADGSAVASYFGGGSGVEGDPYIISVPKHVYNLAWLQYMGTFNEMKSDGTALAQQYFFVLQPLDGKEIDMSGWTIPPIGTKEHPFVGNFDGQGFTISNVTVANVVGGDDITARPPAVEEVHNGEIIGFFGVIGEYGEQKLVSNEQLGQLQVSNLVLKDVTIRASTEQALAGLFAGFVNGTIQDIKITSGRLDLISSVQSPYTETFLSGNENEFIVNKENNNVVYSRFALIGDYYTTQVQWEGMPGPSVDSGQGAGFGGSIDMLSLAKRVTYMLGAGYTDNIQKGYYSPTTTVSEAYSMYGFTGSTDYVYSVTATSNQMFSFTDKTYLPLNINIDDANLTQNNYTNYSTGASQSNPDAPLSTNTGYLVGGKDSLPTGTMVTLKSHPIERLNYSVPSGSTAWEMLTIDSDGNYIVIGDSYNNLTTIANVSRTAYKNGGAVVKHFYNDLGFTQYTKFDSKDNNNVRQKLANMLSGQTMVHTLQLAKQAITTDTLVFTDGKKVNLGSKEVESLVLGSVHFYVEDPGVVTMVAATLPHNGTVTNGYHYLPKLCKVERNQSNPAKIDALDHIEYIYKHFTTGEISYEDKSGDTSNWKCVYNYNAMGMLTTYDNDDYFTNSLFYFEIPIDKGEYIFTGATARGSSQTYLLYLDIGGNAGKQNSSNPSTNPDANPGAQISGVNFAVENGDAYTTIEKYVVVSKSNTGDGHIIFTPTATDVDLTSSNMTGDTKSMVKETETTGP